MPKFIIAYHGGRTNMTPEEGKAHFAKYQEWLGGLGDAAVEPANPLGPSNFVTASGVTSDGFENPMSGYTVVTADDLDGATEIAKGCPFLDIGGTLRVAEIKSMR